jgi:hypothetical protein
MNTVTLSKVLGFATLGIAATEIFAPRWLQAQLGVKGHDGLVRAMGVRELISGLDLLPHRRNNLAMTAGLWSRVAGDAIDLALLAAAARTTRNPEGVAVAAALVAGIAAVDVYASVTATRERASLQTDLSHYRVQPTAGHVRRAAAVA